MPTTTKTYTYNGSVITDTSVGIRFTDGVLSPKNWEPRRAVWTDQEKKDRGITWTTNTVYSGGSEVCRKTFRTKTPEKQFTHRNGLDYAPDLTIVNCHGEIIDNH